MSFPHIVPKLFLSSAATYRNYPGARDALRRATQDIHERLHGHIVFRRVLDRSITRDEYRALLARLYGFHRRLRRPYLHTQMSDPIWKWAGDDALTCWLPI
jgi:heme oxygenase